MTKFANALEAAEELSLDEQEELVSTLRRRVTERRREEIIADVKAAQEEYARGGLKPASVAEIMKQIVE